MTSTGECLWVLAECDDPIATIRAVCPCGAPRRWGTCAIHGVQMAVLQTLDSEISNIDTLSSLCLSSIPSQLSLLLAHMRAVLQGGQLTVSIFVIHEVELVLATVVELIA